MRHIERLLLLLTLTIFPVLAQAEEITITVKGMVCSFCAQGIKKTFGKNENVKSIDVDLNQKLVTVETKKDLTISDKDIEQTIKDAGYEVLKIERGKGA